MKSLMLAIGSILILSQNCFAINIPNELNCVEKSVVWRPHLNPTRVNITFKNSYSSCSSCGVVKFYTMTYPNGTSYVVSDNYYSPNTAFFSDINSISGKKYFTEIVGAISKK